MAINFLQDISLNNTQLTNFKVQNLTGTLPASLAGEGQLIYKTDTNEIYLHKGSNVWEELSTGGSVTSVGISSNYFTVGSSPITSSGTISVNMPNSGVTAASYTLASISVNAQGIITSASSGSVNVGVTSVTTTDGTYINLTPNSATAGAVTVTADLNAGGSPSAATFLRGDNTWAGVPGGYTSWTLQGDSGTNLTVSNGVTVDLAGGVGIGTATTASGMTLTNTGVTSNIAGTGIGVSSATGGVTITNTGVTSAVAGSNISVSSATGAVTIAYTGGTGSMSSWILTGDTGTQTIANGNTVAIKGGVYLTTAASATDTLTVDHDSTTRTNTTSSASPGSAGTFTAVDSVTSNSTGHVTGLNLKTITMPTVPTSDNYRFWTLQGDSGTNLTVNSAVTVDLAGGTGITTATTATGTTITNSGVTEIAGGTGISSSASTGSVTLTNTGVTSAVAGSNISVSSGTGAVTIAYTGGTGSMSSWSLAADSGTTQSITNGNTVTIQGSTGIDTAVSATDDVTINLDLNELSTTTTWTSGSDFLAVVDGGSNAKILSGNIPLNDWGTPNGDIALGNNKLTGLKTATAGTDAVNLNQLNSAVIGLLEFKGGFNASTGVIDGGATNLTSGAARVAIAVGDFYVVTTAGNFFGNAAEPLSIGDQVICITAAGAGTSVQGDFVEVQANIDIATTTTVGLVSVPTAGGINVNGSGAISLDAGANTTTGSVTETSVITTNAFGQVTSQADATIAIPASQITNFCAAVTTCIGDNHNFVANIGDGSSDTYAITHNLGTRDVMVQAYRNESPYDQIMLGIQRTSTTVVTLSTVEALSTDEVRVIITEVL